MWGAIMNKSPLFASAVILLGILAPAFAADQNHLAMQKMNMMPLSFTQNNGQWADSILFRANAGGATMWFTDGGVYYQFTRRVLKSEEIYVGAGFPGPNDPIHQRDDSLETMLIKATFVGANPNPQMHGEGLMEYKCNYFFGNDSTKWRTDVPNYQAIVFENIYAGIDLKYYGDGRKMEYDFVVSPGADPNQICVKYDGAKSLAVNDAGDLVVGTEWGTVTELAPMVYQMENGERRLLKGAYRLESGDMFSIRLSDEYDPELAVVIDPALAYSTYLGGGISERGYSIAVDSAGCAYLTGFTNSSDFPTQNPYDGSYNGGGLYGHDIFVTKLSASGSALAYSTYLGGNDDDVGQSIAVDNAGCAYLTGYTFSTDFPTQNPYDGSLDGTADAFVVKLSGPGDVLV